MATSVAMTGIVQNAFIRANEVLDNIRGLNLQPAAHHTTISAGATLNAIDGRKDMNLYIFVPGNPLNSSA